MKPIDAGESVLILTYLTTEANVILGASDLSTLVFTLTDLATGDVINSKTDIDILDTGVGLFSASNEFSLLLEPDDNVIVTTGKLKEIHRVEITGTWTDAQGDHAIKEKIDIEVVA